MLYVVLNQDVVTGKRAHSLLSFISQPSSWSRLEASADATKELLATYSVSPSFLDALHAFGAKTTGDDDPFFSLCHRQTYRLIEDGDDSHTGRKVYSPQKFLTLMHNRNMLPIAFFRETRKGKSKGPLVT